MCGVHTSGMKGGRGSDEEGVKDGERRGGYCCFIFSWDMSVIGSSFGFRKGGRGAINYLYTEWVCI